MAIRALLAVLAAWWGPTPAEVNLYVAPGGAQYTSVQSAIDAVPANNTVRHVINIAPGTYHERIKVPADKPYVTFRGLDPNTTILTFDLRASSIGPDGNAVGTSGSASTLIEGHDLVAESVTFENSSGDNVGQAVAVRTRADRLIFYNCRFIGWQDTLYADRGSSPGRQYYQNCYIDGDVDFIFGNGKAYFEGCQIHSKGGGAITAQSRDNPNMDSGYVFHNCRLTRAAAVGDAKVDLGRPWRAYATVVFDRCWMDSHIRPTGWNNWRDPNKEATAFFAEHSSTGPGANPAARVAWSRQLTDRQAEAYSKVNWLRGRDNWNPQTPQGGTISLVDPNTATLPRRGR